MSLLLVKVFIRVMLERFSDDSRGRQEIVMFGCSIFVSNFCRFANGRAKILIKSYFMKIFFVLSAFNSSDVLGKTASIQCTLPTAAC